MPYRNIIQSGGFVAFIPQGCAGNWRRLSSHGVMDEPVQIHSHGGASKLLQDGELNIDVAFSVPCSDEFGNANGTHWRSCCGSLGCYAMVDARTLPDGWCC